jgi:hypothetical protein
VATSLNGFIETISHQVDRLTIQIDDSFDGFKNRYEHAVPRFQRERFDSLVERGVDWQTILEATAQNAPHEFILYWSGDFTSLMGLAGDRGRCVEYLMGNHTIAQRMYRYSQPSCSMHRYALPSWKTPTAPRGSPLTNPAPGSAASTHPKSPR